MSSDYWWGLATLPAASAGVVTALMIRRFFVARLSRLAGANVRRRAVLAARLMAARRAWFLNFRWFTVSLTAGYNMTAHDAAEAALLDEFEPLSDVTTSEPA